MADSLRKGYFDSLYAANSDPWNFAHSAYEEQKYGQTVAALPRPQYRCALEIGCSIGVLTKRLAKRCEKLLAVDISSRALDDARQRCSLLPHVEFLHSDVLVQYPSGLFDLIVLSEVGYYWSTDALSRIANETVDHLSSDGQLLLVHWTPAVSDYPLTGDEVHNFFDSVELLANLRQYRSERYRLDVYQKTLA